MGKLILILILIFTATVSFSQTEKDSITEKSNPIIFVDFDFGYAYFAKHGFSGGLSVNYQLKKDFFKFRFTQNIHYNNTKFLAFIPISSDDNIYNEYSLMYGKRYIKNDFSFHFTAGLSYNYFAYRTNSTVNSETNFLGFPLEVGFHWFPPKKERFRILFGIIPVGKPTSFVRSTALKLKANIAKQSYIGVSLSIGLGWYKKY